MENHNCYPFTKLLEPFCLVGIYNAKMSYFMSNTVTQVLIKIAFLIAHKIKGPVYIIHISKFNKRNTDLKKPYLKT